MPFYDLPKHERVNVVANISNIILKELENSKLKHTILYFADDDTYIRKSAYLSLGRLYFSHKALQPKIIKTLDTLLLEEDFKIRQTVINTAGEIGKRDFNIVQHFFDKGLFDTHHAPRNAVIGSIKKWER